MSTKQVIIVGGGLAGLTAAHTLAVRGVSVTLFESDSRLGGRLNGGESARVKINDREWSFPSEHGIHGIWGQYNNVRALMQQLDPVPTMIPAKREAWIHRTPTGRVQWAEGGSALRKSWIPAPFHYLALFLRPRFLQILTLRDLASMFRVLTGLFLSLAYDPAVEGVGSAGGMKKLTLADFFRGWSPTLRALFVGLARNFTSAHPENVPQAGFIAFLRFYTLTRRDAWAFTYLDRDSDAALIDPLRRKLESLGVQIRTESRVSRIAQQEDGSWQVDWQNSTSDEDTATHTENVPYVILALDSPACRKLLMNSPNTAGYAARLRWAITAPTAILRYWFSTTPKGIPPEAGIFTGSFVLDNYFWLHRFQKPFEEWHAQTGGSAVECHIYGPPETLSEPDAVLLTRGLVDLHRVWGNLRNTMVRQTIRRNPNTHSLFSAGGDDQLGVDTPWAGVWACGDWVRYPHPALYMERAVVTGIAAANGVLNATHSEPVEILPAQQPELLVRGFERVLRLIRVGARSYNQRRKKQ